MNSVNGSPEGHEASVSGLYCSDQFDTLIGYYGWPANLFGDGIFYRFGFVVQAEHMYKVRETRRKGTHEVVFPAEEVYIVGLVVLPDCTLHQGWPRFYDFDLLLETCPPGAVPPRPVVVNVPPRRLEKWG